MGHRDGHRNGMGMSLPLLGLGVAAGWMLRKMLQLKYEEISGEGRTSASDREMIETVFGEYSTHARRSVAEVRREVNTRMKNLQTSLHEIDVDKYKELVRGAIESVGRDGRLSSAQMTELQDYLIEDFQHVRRAGEREATKAARTTRRSVKKTQE